MQCNLMNLMQCNLRQWNDMSCHCTALYCNVMYCTVCVHACKYLYVHTYLYTLCLYTCICDLDSICGHIYVYIYIYTCIQIMQKQAVQWNGLPLSKFHGERPIFSSKTSPRSISSSSLVLSTWASSPQPGSWWILATNGFMLMKSTSFHVHLSQAWVYSTYIYIYIYRIL